MKQYGSDRAVQIGRRIASALTQGVTKAGDNIQRYAACKVSQYRESKGPVVTSNWYSRAAGSCEAVGDAILNESNGTSQRLVNAVAGKLGAIGAPAALFSTAALLGTASTGTAIGSLSGAAFSSAALAWLGGSVAVGGAIVAAASVLTGVGFVLGAGWAGRKYVFGKKRTKSELNEQEIKLLDACLTLAIAFRNEEKAGRHVDPILARVLYDEALTPLCDELLAYEAKPDNWPRLARARLNSAIQSLFEISRGLLEFSQRRPNFTTGIIGAVITQLLADDLPDFNANEQIVLDALRRSKRTLTDASDEDLAAYVQSMEPEQLQGLGNNLLGISHELRYAVQENSDGDEYVVELFDETNHPGADARIINTETGEIREVQLKATNFESHLESHYERYGGIPVTATEELAASSNGVDSSGMSHEELTGDVGSVLSGLGDVDDPGVLQSMSVAGVITLARNIRVLLKGNRMTTKEQHVLVNDGLRAAIVAGLVHTVIG